MGHGLNYALLAVAVSSSIMDILCGLSSVMLTVSFILSSVVHSVLISAATSVFSVALCFILSLSLCVFSQVDAKS